MAKNVSAIVSGAGWIADFAGKLIDGLRERGCSDEEIHGLVTSRAKLAMAKICDEVSALIRQEKNVFRLTGIGDGRTTEGLVRDGRYDYANSCVNSKNFPVRPMKRGVREIVLLEFDREVTSEEAITEAVKHGLERPIYEDALCFGVEHPEVQRERPVIFLHEPWRDPRGDLDVLALWSSAGYRLLNFRWFEHRWHRYCRFAFARKSS